MLTATSAAIFLLSAAAYFYVIILPIFMLFYLHVILPTARRRKVDVRSRSRSRSRLRHLSRILNRMPEPFPIPKYVGLRLLARINAKERI